MTAAVAGAEVVAVVGADGLTAVPVENCPAAVADEDGVAVPVVAAAVEVVEVAVPLVVAATEVVEVAVPLVVVATVVVAVVEVDPAVEVCISDTVAVDGSIIIDVVAFTADQQAKNSNTVT